MNFRRASKESGSASPSRCAAGRHAGLENLADPLPVPSGGRALGRVTPPPSKSVSHRYLNLSLLGGGSTRLRRLLAAEDIDHFLNAVGALGFELERSPDSVTITSRLSGSESSAERRIFVGNAGTMYRFLIATLATLPGRWLIDGTPRLRERPVAPLVDALRQLGAEVEYPRQQGFAPIRVHGSTLVGGHCQLDASQSSQYLSAILMAATRAKRPATIEARGLTSGPYVAVTLAALAAFGLDDCVERRVGDHGTDVFEVVPGRRLEDRLELSVEGDFSAAAYPAAAALITGGRVQLEGLSRSSAQGDRKLFQLLADIGAEVDWRDGVATISGAGNLRSVDVDLSTMPDQVPTMAAVATFCQGSSSIRNVPHLRLKESDRLSAMSSELTRAGVELIEHQDGLTIHGNPGWLAAGSGPTQTAVIDSHDDHRIAMSMALVGLRRSGLSIARPEVVGKSYPAFWSDLFALFAEG